MLTGYQCETVAYIGDGEIICRDCALQDYSSVALEKLDMGLACAASDRLSPLSRYSLGEYVSETAAEYVNEELNYDDDPAEWQRRFDELADHYCCDGCGSEIDV